MNDSGPWRLLFVVVGVVGGVAAVIQAIRIYRLPDDHLRALEPDPRNDPETRARRSALASLLAATAVVALVWGIGGFGFGEAVFLRAMLIGLGWPLLLLGSVWRVLVSREGQARTRA